MRVGDAQHLAHIARVRLDSADGIDLVQAAENSTHVGVLHLAHQKVRRAHVDAQDMGKVRFGFQRNKVVIGRHHAQLGNVGNRMAGLDGDHQRIDLTNAVGEANSVALFEQTTQIIFEYRRVLLVSYAGETERWRHLVS